MHILFDISRRKNYGTETSSSERVLSKEHFYEKIMQKLYTESQCKRPLLNFGKWTKTAIVRSKLFEKWDILKEDYQKALKSLTLCLVSNSIYFNEQNHEKQKVPEPSNQSGYR